jgi:hypothetical protein
MRIDALLCNHAEAVNNLLYLSGGGINVVNVPPGAPPPYPSAVGIGIQVTVPWTQTNQQHRLTLEIVGEDGQPMQVPAGPDAFEPVGLEIAFNVGRPPHLHAGDDQMIALAANLAGIPFPALGKYIFQLRIDGDPVPHTLPLRVMLAPGAQVMPFRTA